MKNIDIQHREYDNYIRLSNTNITYIYGFEKQFTIWTQGCHLKCKGCWNADTHSFQGGYDIHIEDLYNNIKQAIEIENVTEVTILGGEPSTQSTPLIKLLKLIRQNFPDIGIILYTGYTLEEFCLSNDLLEIKGLVDILKTGRYIHELRDTSLPLIGSTNQKINFLSKKYTQEMYNKLKGNEIEITLSPTGKYEINGYPDKQFNKLEVL